MTEMEKILLDSIKEMTRELGGIRTDLTKLTEKTQGELGLITKVAHMDKRLESVEDKVDIISDYITSQKAKNAAYSTAFGLVGGAIVWAIKVIWGLLN